MESGPGIFRRSWLIETHRRKCQTLFPGEERERSRGYSPLRSHLDTVSRKACQPGLICSTKWINKGWLCGLWGQVSSDHLPTLKLICTGNDPQHLTSTPGERRGCPGESDHVTLPSPPEEELASHICQQLFSHPSTAAHSTHAERTWPLKRIRMRSISDQPSGGH